MAEPHLLLVETTYHSAFRYGGWGWVRRLDGALSGQAGGERNTTAARIDLMGLIAALNGLPPGDVQLRSASPGVIAAAKLVAAPPAPGSEEAPSEDLDLWAQALKAVQGRKLAVQGGTNSASVFLKAWAEVGQDKAKAQGRFSAAIPKSNLAKLAI